MFANGQTKKKLPKKNVKVYLFLPNENDEDYPNFLSPRSLWHASNGSYSKSSLVCGIKCSEEQMVNPLRKVEIRQIKGDSTMRRKGEKEKLGNLEGIFSKIDILSKKKKRRTSYANEIVSNFIIVSSNN